MARDPGAVLRNDSEDIFDRRTTRPSDMRAEAQPWFGSKHPTTEGYLMGQADFLQKLLEPLVVANLIVGGANANFAKERGAFLVGFV